MSLFHHTHASALSPATRCGAAAFLLFLVACAGGGSPTGPPAPPPLADVTWSWLDGGLGADSLFAIGGSAADNIYVASERGMLRFDGSRWQLANLGQPEPRLRSIWSSGTRSFAVGNDGVIFQLKNNAWSETASPVSTTLNDIYGVSANAVYACGVGTTPGTGTIIAFNGSSWAPLINTPEELRGIWAAASNELFVVGTNGYFAHYAAGILTPLLPAGAELSDVWGTSASNVYAVGDLGVVWHLDESGIENEAPAVSTHWYSVSGSSAAKVHVVGASGALLDFDGAGWKASTIGLTDRMVGVWGNADGAAWAVGAEGSVLKHDGSDWHVHYAGTTATWHAVAYDIRVGEKNAAGFAAIDPDSWSFVEPLYGLTAFSTGNAYAVGKSGAIYHFDGNYWTRQTSNTLQDLNRVVGLRNRFGEPLRMYAAGTAGSMLVWKGSLWTPATLPPGAASMNFVDVWAGAIDDVFAVANNSSSILRFDDPTEQGDWTLEAAPTTGSLIAVTGFQADTYVATSLGEILRLNGTSWRSIAGATSPIRGIQAVKTNAFYAVGERGSLLYYEDGRWSNFSPDYFGDFLDVWVYSGGGPVITVGTNGAMWYHIDE